MPYQPSFVDKLCWRLKAINAPKVPSLHLAKKGYQPRNVWNGVLRKLTRFPSPKHASRFSCLQCCWYCGPTFLRKILGRTCKASSSKSISLKAKKKFKGVLKQVGFRLFHSIFTYWLTLPPNTQEQPSFQWVEFFAGKGEATRMFGRHGFTSGRLDILDMSPKNGLENPLDLCTDSGMAKHAFYR